MRRALLVIIVLVLGAFACMPPPAAALDLDGLDSCALAAWAGWHHPGLNAACLAEIIFTLVAEGQLSPEYL